MTVQVVEQSQSAGIFPACQAYPSAFAGPLPIGFVFVGHSLNLSRGRRLFQ
jgi:hypothetical protein